MLKRISLIFMSMLLTTSCGQPNLLSEFSQKEGDDILFAEAQKKLDAAEWSATLNILESQLSSTYRTQNKVQDMRISAYAGRCGLMFFTFVDNLTSSGNFSLFNFFMRSVTGRSVNPADCAKANEIMVATYGASSARTNSQNFNMAILGMAQAGAYLRKSLDQDSGGAGDGYLDGSTDICDTNVISDDDVTDAFMGFGTVMDNLASVGADLAGATVTQIDDFKNECTTALGAPCDFADRAFILSNVQYFRSILNHPDIGAGSCGTDTPFTACPCDGM